jgi:hypothetical protein
MLSLHIEAVLNVICNCLASMLPIDSTRDSCRRRAALAVAAAAAVAEAEAEAQHPW